MSLGRIRPRKVGASGRICRRNWKGAAKKAGKARVYRVLEAKVFLEEWRGHLCQVVLINQDEGWELSFRFSNVKDIADLDKQSVYTILHQYSDQEHTHTGVSLALSLPPGPLQWFPTQGSIFHMCTHIFSNPFSPFSFILSLFYLRSFLSLLPVP